MSWKCTECGYEMNIYRQETSTGKYGKVYDKTTYECKRCDVWDVHEVPHPEEVSE
jgi:hypothetical protein